VALLFNSEVLFVHVPKAGGTSVSVFLFDVLTRPIWYVRETDYERADHDGLIRLPGRPHAKLAEADSILRRNGLDVRRMRLVLAVVRNPYEAAVSEYAYFRRPDVPPRAQGLVHQRARDLSFPEYVAQVMATPGHFTARLDQFYTLQGQMPANMRVIRFEALADGVRSALREIGIDSPVPFPWLNASKHDDYVSYYDSAAEEMVFRRFRWVFERGYYDRLQLTTTGFNAVR
jgi:hypothetical protein